jgi:hypothetical protein
MISMWWSVKQTSAKEVHVFPLEEEREHVLDDGLCRCIPEVKISTSGSMVVHKKKRSGKTLTFRAHWIR